MKGLKMAHYTKSHLTECKTAKNQKRAQCLRLVSDTFTRPMSTYFNATINENHEDERLVDSL